MRARLAVAILIAALSATPASADRGSEPPRDPVPAGGPEVPAERLTPRQQAEALYADAWKEIEKARQDLADGKARNAAKKFERALDRLTRATDLDTTYHEAWNLVGYTSRKLGRYDASLAAYERCLRIRPDYAPAREYLGEAYVELGRMDDARAQLQFLERLGAKDLAGQLRARIEAARADSSGARRDSAARTSSGW